MRIWQMHRVKDLEGDQVVGQYRISAGGAGETLLPADIGLRTIDFFMGVPITRFAGAGHGSTGFLIGSMYQLLGSPDIGNGGPMSGLDKAWGARGSGVVLTFVRTSGSAVFAGTALVGTRNAMCEIVGRI